MPLQDGVPIRDIDFRPQQAKCERRQRFSELVFGGNVRNSK